MRRAVRSGDAEGMLIEDAGVPGQPYAMTMTDIFESNADLIEHCAGLLVTQPWTQLDVRRHQGRLLITSAGLDHVDVFADGHPLSVGIPISKDGTVRVPLPATGSAIEVTGFSEGVIRQRRRIPARSGRK